MTAASWRSIDPVYCQVLGPPSDADPITPYLLLNHQYRLFALSLLQLGWVLEVQYTVHHLCPPETRSLEGNLKHNVMGIDNQSMIDNCNGVLFSLKKGTWCNMNET